MNKRTPTQPVWKLFFLAALLITAILTSSTPTQATTQPHLPPTIRIGLTSNFANRETITIANTNITTGHNNNGQFSSAANLNSSTGFTARVSGGHVALYSGTQRVFTFNDTTRGAQIICANGGTVRLGSYTYRGAIEFRPSGGRLTAINVLPPEYYLLGVLPSEMSPSSHAEALKAQAIASRTFMVYRMNEGGHRNQGFDLCDTTHCQAYRGSGREHVNSTSAVNQTHGQMLFYNNAPILAVYFACCGGVTDYSQNVWSLPKPYLRAVRSITVHNPSEWTRTFTMAQLTTAVTNAGGNIGTATGMSVSRTSALGRVQEITVYGTTGQWRVTGEAVRSFFSPVGGSLMSRNFYIAGATSGGDAVVSVTDGRAVVSGGLATFQIWNAQPRQTAYVFDGTTLRRVELAAAQVATGSSVTLVGSGWGHGVGMSQRGAMGMALLGYSYREILQHYYTGAEIR